MSTTPDIPIATPERPVRLCFVCLGNICRSPTAEAVMRGLVVSHGLDDRIEIESAGTADWHIGKDADPRSRAEWERRGLSHSHTAQTLTRADLGRFDLILTMDTSNMDNVQRLRGPRDTHARIMPLRTFDPLAGDDLDVPDPYYGGDEGFVDVFDMVERSCRGLLARLISNDASQTSS